MDKRYPILFFIIVCLYVLAIGIAGLGVFLLIPGFRDQFQFIRILPAQITSATAITVELIAISMLASAEILRILIDISNSLDEISQNTRS